MKGRDTEGRMSIGAPSYELLVMGSVRAGGASYHRRQSGQWLDQPIGEASNEGTKVGEGRVG
jgi:hypothetical protein